MSPIAELDCEFVRTWVRHSPSKKIITLLTGQIIWANDEFLAWSGYTWGELSKMSWMQLSAHDDDLQADIDAAKSLSQYNLKYTVQKKYMPKNAAPQLGRLTVMRFPPIGEIQYCGCTWEPIVESTSAAFITAIEQAARTQKRLEEMTAELKITNSRTDEETFLISGVRMIQRHPKIAAAGLVLGLSIFGLNNVVELLQRVGIIRLPIEVHSENSKSVSAFQIKDSGEAKHKTYTVITPSGRVVSWSTDDGMPPVTSPDPITGRVAGPFGSSYDLGRVQHDGRHGMSNEWWGREYKRGAKEF